VRRPARWWLGRAWWALVIAALFAGALWVVLTYAAHPVG
jgi:hypothetical protein